MGTIHLNRGKIISVGPTKRKKKPKKKVIYLTPKKKKKKKKQKFYKTGLDIISSIMLEPTTLIRNPLEAGRKVRARREDIRETKDPSKVLDVIGETVTMTALLAGGVLGAGTAAGRALVVKTAPKLIPKTLKGQLMTFTGLGVLTTSSSARKLVGRIAQDPTKMGREAGLMIDKAMGGKDVGGFGEALKKAGLIGAVVAGGVGAVALGKKLFGGKDKEMKTPEVTAAAMPSTVPSAQALPSSAIPDSLAPITAEPVIAEPEKEEEKVAVASPVNVRITNKPQVNVAVAQSL